MKMRKTSRRKLLQNPYNRPLPTGTKVRKRPKVTQVAFGVGDIGRDPSRLADAMDALKEEALKRVDKTFDNIAPMVNPKEKREYRVRQRTGTKTMAKTGRIPAPAGSDDNDKRIHIHVTHDVKVQNLMLGSETVSVFKQKVETGIPSSRALKRLAKENGTTSLTLFDTKVNRQGITPQHYKRDQLTVGTGFDQKGLTVYDENSIVTYKDMFNLMAMEDNATAGVPSISYQKILASVLNTRNEFSIRNQSAHLKAKVIIHLCKYRRGISGDSYLFGLANDVFVPDIFGEQSNQGKRTEIPGIYQFTDTRIESSSVATEGFNNYSLSVDYDPSVPSIFSYSPFFKEHYEIVKSEGQMLGPGDFYNFSHVHHFGPGFDITKIYGQAPVAGVLENLNDIPTSYFYMIEYVGEQSEISYLNPTDNNFEAHIGRSPVILSLEMKKKITFINSEKNPEDIQASGITTARNMHVRYFNKRDVNLGLIPFGGTERLRKFNLPLDKWSTAGTPPAGSYVLAVASDRSIRTDTHAAGNSTATDMVP